MRCFRASPFRDEILWGNHGKWILDRAFDLERSNSPCLFARVPISCLVPSRPRALLILVFTARRVRNRGRTAGILPVLEHGQDGDGTMTSPRLTLRAACPCKVQILNSKVL